MVSTLLSVSPILGVEGTVMAKQISPLCTGPVIVLSLVFWAPPCAAVSRCILDGGCAPEHTPPDFGPDARTPPPPGGGGSPVFSLAEQEPYRNSDMGPLGVVISTGEFQMTVTDSVIPGRGFPFKLTRTYHSKRERAQNIHTTD